MVADHYESKPLPPPSLPTAQRIWLQCSSVAKIWIKSSNPIVYLTTTHSPFALNLFEADEVQMMASKDGNIFVKRLSEHPLWERWSQGLCGSVGICGAVWRAMN